MNKYLDKQAFKFGLIAAVVSVLIPLVVQMTLTAEPFAANIA